MQTHIAAPTRPERSARRTINREIKFASRRCVSIDPEFAEGSRLELIEIKYGCCRELTASFNYSRFSPGRAQHLLGHW